GRVEDHDVVGGAAVGPSLGRVPPGLAEHRPLLHAWNGAQERAYVAVVEEGLVEGAAVEHERAVLLEGPLRLDVDRPDVLTDGGHGRSEGRHAQHDAETLARVAHGHQDALALRREGEGFGSAYGGLAYAPLAGDQNEALVGERRHAGMTS